MRFASEVKGKDNCTESARGQESISMDLEARVAHWERRQENMIASMHEILNGLEAMRGQLADVVAWLQQPPSDDLPDLIRAMIAASDATHEQLSRLDSRMASLAEKVAQLVKGAVR